MKNLLDLPLEIIDKILSYCDIYDVYMLARCCRDLRCMVQTILHLKSSSVTKSIIPLVTNLIKDDIKRRSAFYLPPQDKYRVSHNWMIGKYSEKYILKQNTKLFMPCISLDNKYLWASQGKHIKRYRRNQIENGYDISIGDRFNEDICKFTLSEKFLLAGLGDGKVWLKENNNKHKHQMKIFNAHSSDVHGVSLSKDLFATGSKDKTVKIWSTNQYRQRNITPCNILTMNDRIWCVQFNINNNLLAIGTGGHSQSPLVIQNIESNVPILTADIRPSTSILAIRWENENCLLTGGHDSYLRLWDLRIGYCVCKWEEPHDSTLYCIQTDNLYTVMCGTQNHGKVILWDKRKRNYVQMYYLQTYRKQSSPVFSLDFDSCHLYAAIDHSINILEFYSRNNRIQNYGDLYVN